MPEKKKYSIWRTASLTVVLLVICAALSVATINLIVIPFMNSANQPKAVTGSVPQVARVTATVDFEQGPPPPGTPTGELATPLPTLSKDELHTVPTAEYPPDVPTLEPTKDIEAVAPTLAPVISIAPDGEWSTYIDPNLGFSLQYPSNWHITAPESMTPDYISSKGTFVTIESYTVQGDTKGGVPQDALKVELHVVPEFGKYETIAAWFGDYQKRESSSANDDPTYSLSDVRYSTLQSLQIVQWTQQGAGEPAGGLYAAVGQGKWLYFFSAYPATSAHGEAFSRILESFKGQ